MVVQARLESHGDAIQDDIDSLNAVNEIVNEAGAKVLAKISPFALEEMRHYPPPAKLPFEFATEKSRNYYFVLVRKGLVPTANGRYLRTGGLADSMFFSGTSMMGRYVFKAGARAKAAIYTVGGFNRSLDTRVPGHINTGWPKLSATVDFWLDAADEEMKKEIHSTYIAYRSSRRNR